MKAFNFVLGMIVFLCFSSESFAIKCGTVPIYCVMEIDQTGDHTATTYETMPLLVGCIETYYKFPNAGPICKIVEFDKQTYFEKCRELYPDGPFERVVAIAFYKGGDPVSPLSKTNPHLWGNSFYKVTELMTDAKNMSVKGSAVPACDIIGDAL